jgi:hypothetical protein
MTYDSRSRNLPISEISKVYSKFAELYIILSNLRV